MNWQPVPQTWYSSRKTPVVKTVICTWDDAHRSIGLSKSARAEVRGQYQIRQCLAGQTLEDQNGDLEGHSLTHGQSVELSRDRRDVVTAPLAGYKSLGVED